MRDACALHSLPDLCDGLFDQEHAEEGRALAWEAAEVFLREHTQTLEDERWRRLWCGMAMGVLAWMQWLERARDSAPRGTADPRQEMVELLRRKAPHAQGYHKEKRIGDRRIDDWLNPDRFEPSLFSIRSRAHPTSCPERPTTVPSCATSYSREGR